MRPDSRPARSTTPSRIRQASARRRRVQASRSRPRAPAPEHRTGILRERDEHVPLVLWRREPRDRHVTPARAQRRTVDGTAIDLPPIVVNRDRFGPCLADEARHRNIARLIVGAIAEGDDGAGRGTATAVGQQSHTRVSIASSDSCFQSWSNVAVRRPISFFARPSSHTRPSAPPGASNSDANPCSLFVPS